MLDGGTLRVSIKNSTSSSADGATPARDWIRITIQDSGIGLPSDVAASAFESFPSSKAGRASLSLGLPNAHTVIVRHGGSIQIRSAVGQGTTFLIRLPATSRRSEKPRAFPSSRPAPDRQMRLLVVDDEPANRTSLARLLTMRGYQVVLAEDGPSAIRECEQNDQPIDLVLLDLLMPGMNGKDVLLALRQRRPSIKVMVVTGFAEPSLIEDAIHLGAVAVAHKPFNVPDLLDQVRKFTSPDFVPPQVS
jgi:CheY-like chemotaxis protein